MDSIVVLLALPSAAVLVALVAHGVRNRGARATAAYLAALFAYGAARSLTIRKLTREDLGSPFPYLMNRPVATIIGVSLQELMGWAVAVTLAWLLADRLLRRSARIPTPHRVTALAGLAMAVICLAVENAAITAGWWTWTVTLPRSELIRVPLVALLDWGFVASDFLLPFLALATRASWRSWAPALVLFPLHMIGHTWLAPLPGPLPVAGNDLVHVGTVAYVLLRALGESGSSALPDPTRERWRFAPPASALVVVGATALASFTSGAPSGALASLPLLAWAAVALPLRRAGTALPAATRGTGRRLALRLGVVAAATAFLVAVRVPAMRQQQAFVAAAERGMRLLGRGDTRGAEVSLREAVAARPHRAAGHTLLALALLRQGRRAEARAEMDEALAREPTARDALILSAALDLSEGRTARAAERAALGRRVHPGRVEFAYLEAVAAGRAGRGKPAARDVVETARIAGEPALSALADLAANLGDQATAAACRQPAARD